MPFFVLLNIDVAVTVILPDTLELDGITSSPSWFIVTPAVADVPSTDHKTAWFANPVVATTADSYKLWPFDIVADAGFTVTPVTVGCTVTNTQAFSNGELESTPQACKKWFLFNVWGL